MVDPFLSAAGPSPARGTAARWRQVALLAAASAINDAPGAPAALAGALHALDLPDEAISAAARAPAGDPWAAWWRVLSLGARDGAEIALEEGARARGEILEGPDASEVARRLSDLEQEVEALRTGEDGSARFALVGTGTSDGGRRAVLVGRSSAQYLVVPSWEGATLVRLAPSDGPSSGNRAHHRLSEVVAAICRGESGLDRGTAPERPARLGADDLVGALRGDDSDRDRRLLALAEEVQRERAYLSDIRAELEAERIALNAERRRARPDPPRGANGVDRTALPSDRASAAELLGVATTASGEEVEQAYRAQIGRAHPDRVDGMHPAIRDHAERLTIALNAARDLLLGRGGRRRPRYSQSGSPARST
jgi:DnaJ-domain-containing protein 1